ncbi:MAG: hypothetical protein KBT34_03360 [Prevotella sp.]|nr:hypothetical protein [Candidatus Prevotella equi]
MKHFYFILTLLSGIILVGCSSIDCSIEGRVMCHYAIQDKNGNDVQLAYPLTVTLQREATFGDTVFINNQGGVSTLDLPMSHVGESDEIRMSIGVTYTVVVDTIETQETEYITDVVKIKKNNSPVFESIDCTPRFNHEITDVEFTRNFIDTLIINKANVTKDATSPNIIIRLRSSLD